MIFDKVLQKESIRFTDQEKIEMFDEIAARFYQSNFGQASKADIELLMFHYYIEKLISTNANQDGTIDYNKCSDYRISRDLGITQQRVRSLKVRAQLVHPIDYKWEKALATLTKNARYDKQGHKVTLNIPDPNLYLDIQNFIEEHGAYVEKQLNTKILQIRVEYYIDLALHLEPDETRKEIIRNLKNEFKDSEKENAVFDERNLGKSLIDSAADICTIIDTISSIANPGNVLIKALCDLVNKAG